MLDVYQETPIAAQPWDIKLLYGKYSAMLFGYLLQVTCDRQKAETGLLLVYSELENKHSHFKKEIKSWAQLRRLTIDILKLQSVAEISPVDTSLAEADVLHQLTAEQRNVFQHIYYRGTSVSDLALTMNQPEEIIRKLFKEAFSLMKNTRGN